MSEQPHYRLAGIMGWPVSHSRSPLIHNHWIEQYALRGNYVQLPVHPANLAQALRALPLLGFAGCNLTIPHKVAALSLVDHIAPLAQRIGAINTIVVDENEGLTGHNTDAFGFMQSILDAQPQWRGEAGPVAVVGAGGAARAVLASLLDSGARDIRITNRSTQKACDLAAEFGPAVRSVPWAQRSEMLANVTLLVNSTSQGMQGESDLDLALDQLPDQALVCDIVYIPAQTPLLAAARARGNPTVNGLGMLLNQARMAFRLWFGVLPELTPDLHEKLRQSL